MNSEASRLREFLCFPHFTHRAAWESISDIRVTNIKRARRQGDRKEGKEIFKNEVSEESFAD